MTTAHDEATQKIIDDIGAQIKYHSAALASWANALDSIRGDTRAVKADKPRRGRKPKADVATTTDGVDE